MSSLSLLLQESTQDCDLVTIEATVVTGFEHTALEECEEKLGESSKPAVDCGRIYFNIPMCNISDIDDLRSVDNLYMVIKQVSSLDLTKRETEVMEILSQILVSEDISKAVSVWSKKNNFKGITFPSIEQHNSAKDIENKLKSLARTEAETRLRNEMSEFSQSNIEMSDNEKRTKLNTYQVAAYHELDSRCPEEKVVKYCVTCRRSGKHAFGSKLAACHVGGILQDMFHWVVDLNLFDIEFILNIKQASVYYAVALTKESQHNRNISAFGPTTLRATICYNMLRLVKPKPGDIIVDPMCGGGSIPIEGLSAFPQAFYTCGDIHEKAVSRIECNIKNLHSSVMTNHIDAFSWNVNCLPLRNSSVDIFITDLPFGKRSGSVFDNRTLYKNVLVELARVVQCKSGQAVLLTCDHKSMTKALMHTADLWSLKLKIRINIGGLDGRIFLLLRCNKASLMPPPYPLSEEVSQILKKLKILK